MVLLGLFLIFPQKGLEQQLSRTNRSDLLTVEYLKAFLAAEPESPRLRLLLARQLMQLGLYGEARAALRPFASMAMGPARIEAEVYEFDLREREAFALPPDSEERRAATRAAGAQLRQLVSLALTDTQTEYLARRAVAIGANAAAIALYGRQATLGPARAPQAHADAAALVLGLGGYDVSARLYFRAQERSVLPARKREYYMAGVRTLMAGNLYDQAILEADRNLGTLADDAETLKFLARTAQAANRADAAQRYARRLLRMVMLERLRDALAAEGLVLAAEHEAALPGIAAGRSGWQRMHMRLASNDARGPAAPFDEEAYMLGFNIFLAAANLADAYRVAESAVAQVPQSAEWRKRFAQVAEWRGAPQAALAQWLAHARMTGDEASWDAVLRLARGLSDDQALLAVLTHKLDRQPQRVELLEQVIAVHERLGNPAAAIAFVQAQARGGVRQRNLERLAQLALRAGRDRLAFETWQALQTEFGPALRYATPIAAHHYLSGDLRAALAALEAVLHQAGAGETAYWQMYAELARLLQMDAKAIAGYQRLLASEKYSEADLQNLIAMLDAMRPDQAAKVAEFAFARFGRADLALQVLYQHARAANQAAIGRFLGELAADIRAQLERDPRFLGARAGHLQAAGQMRAALADLKAIDALEPRNPDTQAALIWTLIALRDAVPLRQMLIALAPAAEREPLLWGPFAAAHMVLNRQADALRWFRKQAEQKNDYLWLMAFAECLDANAQPEIAWRVRRKVWTDLRRPAVLAALPADLLVSMRDRLASVALVFAAGDRAKLLIESLLRADLKVLQAPAPALPMPATGAELVAVLQDMLPVARMADAGSAGPLPAGWFARSDAAPAPGFPAADNAATVKELALAWALNNESHELARAWLLSRFAAALTRPLWGELSVALAAADRDTLTRLIDDLPDWLPMYDRVEAALTIGRPALARTLAFEQLDHLQFDEELHARFTNMAVEDPARLAGAVLGIRQSPLAISQTRAEASADLSPRLKLGLTLSINRQSTQDETVLINVPQTDSTAAAFLRLRTERGPLTLSVQHRSAMREVSGTRLDYDLALAPRLRWSGNAGYRQGATELAILRVGAMKSGFANTLTWAVSNREYLRAGLAWNHFYSQSGADLGRSTVYNLEAGHRIRIEYPDFNLRWFGTRTNLAASATADPLMASLRPAALASGSDTYLPASSTQWGLGAGWGQYLQDRYTRALRPFFDFSLFHNSLTGSGRALRLGLAGSLAGQDHAVFYFNQSTGTPGAPQGLREFGLTYQWFY